MESRPAAEVFDVERRWPRRRGGGLSSYRRRDPGPLQLAVRHDLIHALEHACLLWFGPLLWLTVIGGLASGNDSRGVRIGYVVGVRAAGAVLAGGLTWAQAVFSPLYRAVDALRGLNPLADGNVAGGVMMVEQVILTTSA